MKPIRSLLDEEDNAKGSPDFETSFSQGPMAHRSRKLLPKGFNELFQLGDVESAIIVKKETKDEVERKRRALLGLPPMDEEPLSKNDQ